MTIVIKGEDYYAVEVCLQKEQTSLTCLEQNPNLTELFVLIMKGWDHTCPLTTLSLPLVVVIEPKTKNKCCM